MKTAKKVTKKKITAKELDEKFDEGKEDILEHFTASTEAGIKRVNVDFPMWVVMRLDKEADRIGVTRQSLIKSWIVEKIDFDDHELTKTNVKLVSY